MYRKTFFRVSFVLVLVLAGNVLAYDSMIWDNDEGVGDRMWDNPSNWDFKTAKVPIATDWVELSDYADANNGPIINADMNAVCMWIDYGYYELGYDAIITMEGGSLTVGDRFTMGYYQAGNYRFDLSGGTANIAYLLIGYEATSGYSTLNISGGALNTLGYLSLGTGVTPQADINMTGGDVNVAGWLNIGAYDTQLGKGHVDLHGGTVKTALLAMGGGGVGTMDLTEGTLIIDGDYRVPNGWLFDPCSDTATDDDPAGYTGTIAILADRGLITAYNTKVGDVITDGNYPSKVGLRAAINLDYDITNPGKTTITAGAVGPNLVAHWKFDEGSGTIAYDYVGDNDGIIYGAQWTTGQIDGALSFDGVNDYVDCGTGPAITGTGTFTTSVWIMKPGGSSGAIVVQRSTTSANGMYAVGILADGRAQFQIYNGGYGFLFQSDVTVKDDLWHHIVVVRTNSTDGEIYIDGSLAGSGSGPAKSLSNFPVWIGRAFTAPDYFGGSIDDVRIYGRALSAEEIWQLYQAAPVACVVGGDQAIEAEAGSGCEARVTLDGSCSSDADSTPGTNDDINDFDWYDVVDVCDPNSDIYLGSGEIIECNLPLGEHDIMLEVTDKAGAFDVNEVTITVEDTTPPEFSLSVTPDVLWPANHKMVEITPNWTTGDNCDESLDVMLVNITMNEHDDGKGDGHTANDIQVKPDGSIYLRAERSRKGTGRVYTITYQAVDDSGNATVQSATVTVPHDRTPPRLRRISRGRLRHMLLRRLRDRVRRYR